MPVNDRSIRDIKIFGLQDRYLTQIFDRFPEFKEVLQIRAMRRHHYFRKLRHQQANALYLREKYWDDYERFKTGMMKLKKARLTEESMQYDDLVVLDNFSEDETTFALDRANIKGRKDKSVLKKSKILKQQVEEMKQF